MFVYLVESFTLLLVAATVFFLFGTAFGWVLWGRFRKMLGEWKHNSERQNVRMRALEDEIDRNNILYAELETEKSEVLEIFAAHKKEYAHMEELLDEAITMRDEADGRIEGRDGAIASRDREIADLKKEVEHVTEELNKRHALVEALNERIEAVSLDRDNRISILKTRLIAAEQERDEQKSEISRLAGSLERGAGSRSKVSARAAKRASEMEWQPVAKS